MPTPQSPARTAKNLENTHQQLELARSQALRALELLIGRYPAAEVNARAELLDVAATDRRGHSAADAGAAT